LVLFVLSRLPPSSPLFPYTTLFRSRSPSRFMALFVGDIEAGTEVWGVSSNNIIPDLQRTGFSMGDNEFDYIIVGGGSAGCVLAQDRKSTRLNSSHVKISYAVFCLKK